MRRCRVIVAHVRSSLTRRNAFPPNDVRRVDRRVRFVIHDGDGQYTRSFGDVFTAVGGEAITILTEAHRHRH